MSSLGVSSRGAMDPSRAFVKDAKRVVVKVGTAVVTRKDGRLALSRLGAICEQVKELMSDGKEVIFVTSGAVEVGRQKLRHQRMMNSMKNSSLLDLQEPERDVDGKTCAAVGQSGLMALYDSLFSLLDVASSQLLVTDNDFRDPEYRQQLSETVNFLLASRVVPIFNENDAVSTRGSPCQDAIGTFWDNDSLAALLALENQADLLILLSDVEGLYTGPPSEPKSELIHTYLKEKHDDMVTFGAKSRVGRGGMTAKVHAAWHAASAGIPVIISSGCVADGLLRVMRGDHIGTLFHKDAHRWVEQKEIGASDMAVVAKDGSRHLQSPTFEERYSIIHVVADALLANEAKIKAENNANVELAQTSGISRSLIDRCTIQPRKIAALANSLRTLANMEEPVGEVLKSPEVTEGLIPEKNSCPSGVVLVVFESLPDAPVQVASPAICSGNGLLLEGGKEAARSTAILHKVECSMSKLPGALTNPYCANGVCHVFVDKAADLDKAKKIVLDSKVDNPTSCNALETLLIHEDLVGTGGLEMLTFALQSAGVTLYGGARASELLKLPRATSFHIEYCALSCTVEVVKDVQAAIDHIHEHGSAHTDSIVTEDQSTADIFLHHVDSATVFHNCSTRFSDGGRIGFGAEVGISTGRIHARSPVGFEGLFTTRWLLRGNGQLVNGDRGVKYTHRNLPIGEDGVRALPFGIVNGPYKATPVSNGSV